MKGLISALPILFFATSAGCSAFDVAPRPRYPVQRSFNAPVEKVWEAAIRVLGDTPLASVDSASGIVITDWLHGVSDTMYSRNLLGREKLQIRYKFVVRVEKLAGGARVRVQNSEYTARTEYVHAGYPAGGFGLRTGHHGAAFYGGGTSFKYDRFEPTPTSTLKEKAFLDRIEAVLRSLYGGGIRVPPRGRA